MCCILNINYYHKKISKKCCGYVLTNGGIHYAHLLIHLAELMAQWHQIVHLLKRLLISQNC